MPTGPCSSLHGLYLQATTACFAAIVICRIGTAFAARTDRSSLRAVGCLGDGAVRAMGLGADAPFPVVVWESDVIVRTARRRRPLGEPH